MLSDCLNVIDQAKFVNIIPAMSELLHYHLEKERVWRMELRNDCGEKMGGLYYLRRRNEFKLATIKVVVENSGVGSALLKGLIEEAQSVGVDRIVADAIPEPECEYAACCLYEKMGFVIDYKSGKMRLEFDVETE